MNKPYFTLAIKYELMSPWSIAFGAYDKEVVKAERDDFYLDCYVTKIVRTACRQLDIEAEIATMNG